MSSFVLLPPLPEDDIAVQLQKMAEWCRHGNNYCKQILSLYQLSKVDAIGIHGCSLVLYMWKYV